MITINDAGAWEQPFTSSRITVIDCPHCGNKRYQLSGPHNPHFTTDATGARYQVDCRGKRIDAERTVEAK